MNRFFITLFCLPVLFAACQQVSPTPDQIPLQTVNGKTIPALLVDQIIEDPGEPPYRLQLEVTDGWFKLEGDRYQQSIGFMERPGRRWRWQEFGTCTPNAEGWRCESGYIQNYVFDLKRQGRTIITEQNFTDPTLKGTYTFNQ